MVFMFQFLLIGNFCFLASNNIVLQKTSYPFHQKRITDLKLEKDVSRNNATFSTQFSPMFMILQNFTRSKNLKQNVFDRMLSEEMFSINNDIHEKDMSYLPTFQPLPKLYVSTPTLVVKQNWLVEKANTTKPGTIMPDSRDAAAPRKEKSKNASVEINKDQDLTIEKINDHNKKDKILGPRSLSHYTRASQRRKETNLRESKLCTCMVTNPSTSCSHVCTGPPSKRHTPACTRKHSITDLQPKPPNLHPLDLDKNSSPVALTPIYPVQYFPNYYIHMSVPSDIYDYEVSTRKRKHKHRKKTKMPDYYITSDKYLYYDEVKTPVEHKDQVDYDEEYKEHINIYFDDDKKVKVPNKKKYSEAAKDKGLVDSLVKDLKKYFSEDVIRECYYSKKSASNVVTVKGNVFLLVIVQFIFQ